MAGEDRAPAAAKGRTSPWLAPLLAFVAGAVDTAGFMLFAGVFLAHVTGNFVLLGASLTGADHGSVVLKIMVLPVYVLGVGLGWWLMRTGGRRADVRLALLQSGLLAACGGLGAAAAMVPGTVRAETMEITVAAIVLAVLAMGVHAMLGRALSLPMTNVMTGNVTQLTVDGLAWLAGDKAARVATGRGLLLVAAFGCGALAAGLAVTHSGLSFMLVPAVCLLPVAAAARRRAGEG